ncbi:MAG: type II secretion system protein N [Candidatus Thiodiazotropha sp.]
MYAEGEVQWLGSALKSPFALKVGDLQADVETDDAGVVQGKIKDLGGATAVNGELSLNPEGDFQVNGQIKPSADSDPKLDGALSAISKRSPDGSYQITYSGRF